MTTTLRTAARNASTHPALRWTPRWAPNDRAQHRRAASGEGTACGITAPLDLAHSLDPYCRTCFPKAR